MEKKNSPRRWGGCHTAVRQKKKKRRQIYTAAATKWKYNTWKKKEKVQWKKMGYGAMEKVYKRGRR